MKIDPEFDRDFLLFLSCSFLDSFSQTLETLLFHLLQLLGSKIRLGEPL